MNQPLELPEVSSKPINLQANAMAVPMRRPLRVLQFICSTGFYGAEGWILALANNSQPDQVQHFLAVTKEWETHDLELSHRFSALGQPVYELPMSHRFDARVIGQLVRLIREQRIDVIHTHGYKSDLLGVIAARRAGIASVCTPHGFENSRDWKLRAFIWLGNKAFRFFDKVVPLSPELLTDVRRLKVPEAKIAYVSNGVDLKPVQPVRLRREARGARAPEDPLIMGYIGQLIERKNVSHIIDTFNSLAERHQRLQLVLVGDGQSREVLRLQAENSPYAERIEFRGFVSNPLEHLQEFDLFVMTSSLEGIPRCLMECMAMGVPVVAYDIPGVDQLLKHERTGLMVPFGESSVLSEQCERLLLDTDLSHSLSVEAHALVHEQFSAHRMAAQYVSIFNDVLSSRTG